MPTNSKTQPTTLLGSVTNFNHISFITYFMILSNFLSLRFYVKSIFWILELQKILKQVEYESARRKRHINEKTRIRDEEGSTFFYVYLHFLIL